MNPSKVDRERVKVLTDLPNIGKACARDLELLGIRKPQQLVGRSPFDLYEALCLKTGLRHDPCVIDVFMSITRFMDGDEPRPWWAFTEERKRLLKEKSLNPTLSD
jgi:Pathogenicity locus